MAEVKLLGVKESPFSTRVEIALQLKGVEYEFIEEDLSNKSPLLLKYNPLHKRVPVLVHDGKLILESANILEYIDETWKHYPILPTDPHERAMARFWAKFIDEKLIRVLWKACWGKEDKREEATCTAHQHLNFLENELKNKRFFGGENIGLVDIIANFLAFWLRVTEEASGSSMEFLTEEKFPMLCKWRNEYVNCSIIKQNLPQKDKVVAIFRARYGVPNK